MKHGERLSKLSFVREVKNEWSRRRTEKVSLAVTCRLLVADWSGDTFTEYVALLVDFLLNKSISSQFEAFSAGFNEVCSGNALSLLKGEELELIVRGSDEPLDIGTLRSVTTLHGFYEDDQVIL
jgi:hypothetical protein